MGSKSKRKGSAGERELAAILRERGHSVYRTYASGAGLEKGDLGGLEGQDGQKYHIECKRQERIEIHRWWEQAVGDCPADAQPLVVFRRNNEKWRVLVDLEHFLELIEN